jgi:putative acetyltransferase
MVLIHQVTDPSHVAMAQQLVREYFAWFFALVPGSESDPTFRGWENELKTIPGVCVPPRGAYLLATIDGAPAGCVTLKPVDEQHGELKRLYVSPMFRGHNVGRQLVEAFLVMAREAGYTGVVLDSHVSMTKAHAIYQSCGFNVVDAPTDFPEALKQSVVFMNRLV